jgi:NAD(P)-dependent dehydrogenase (short-subunit alcohol dehydrogenase family)
MPQSLAGKTALVTGGAKGIGREICVRFAGEGARVISLDIDAAEPVGEFVEGDVSSAADVKRAFGIAGAVDILINNAATWQGDGLLDEVSETAWDRIVAVCLKGVYLCSRQAVQQMKARRSGVIVNISSVNALTGIHLAAYTAAKGGVVSLTRLMAKQYGPFGIRVNAICPGTILTGSSREYYEQHPDDAEALRGLYPGGAFGAPADVAGCALFLATATFMNGSVLVVDGGMSAVHGPITPAR